MKVKGGGIMKRKILVFQEAEGGLQTAQTERMLQKELVTIPCAWVGVVSTKSGFVSGWHRYFGLE